MSEEEKTCFDSVKARLDDVLEDVPWESTGDLSETQRKSMEEGGPFYPELNALVLEVPHTVQRNPMHLRSVKLKAIFGITATEPHTSYQDTAAALGAIDTETIQDAVMKAFRLHDQEGLVRHGEVHAIHAAHQRTSREQREGCDLVLQVQDAYCCDPCAYKISKLGVQTFGWSRSSCGNNEFFINQKDQHHRSIKEAVP